MGTTYQAQRGVPSPLGASKKDGAINFAIFSQHAKGVTLCLFSPGIQSPFAEIPLNPKINRTGMIWHITVASLPEMFDYGWRVNGSKVVVSDPYSKMLNSTHTWADGFFASRQTLSRYSPSTPFNWENDTPPQIPMQNLIIYEMHVRGLTQDASSHVKSPGRFSGIIEKIPYLKELGINAVELLPIFAFDECDNSHKNPKTGKKLLNYWGYSTINFFCPMNRYALADAIAEFKTLVKELHKNRIEVILDVVYNHTAEGNEKGRTFSFRGIDNSVYYLLGPDGDYLNFSGCGNTFNCNHPIVSQLILDSLRYWTSEMHVDGFRFDLASILTRDTNGNPMPNPPVIEAISKDPILANCKLIAEAWDAAGLYQVGSFPAHGRFAEWNGRYRDTVRKFIKGGDGLAGAFSGALAGSQDLYGKDRKPYHSINFITAHDGFSLKDLVSYNGKHNEENGEQNRDGGNDNESWNCGVEGATSNPKIIQFRFRQMKNLHTALMVSIGTPMVLMGDEYGHTNHGNNNMWGHDFPNWFQWRQLAKNAEFHRFYRLMIFFRKRQPLFHRTEFLSPEDVDWHGHLPFQADWSEKSRFVGYTLKDPLKEQHLYIGFNAESSRPDVQLPDPPPHRKWYRIVDTGLESPFDFIEEPQKYPPIKAPYKMEAYSALIAQAV